MYATYTHMVVKHTTSIITTFITHHFLAKNSICIKFCGAIMRYLLNLYHVYGGDMWYTAVDIDYYSQSLLPELNK